MTTPERAGPLRRYSILAWLWVAAGIVLQVVAIAMLSSLPPSILLENWQSWQGRAIAAIPGVLTLLSGGLIAARRPGNRYGWVLLATGFAWGSLAAFGGALSFFAFAHGWPIELVALGNHLNAIAWALGLALLSFVLFLFPTGFHVSARWQWAGRVVIAAAALAIVVVGFLPGPLEFGPPLENPFGLDAMPAPVAQALLVLPTLVLIMGLVLGIASLFVRYRRAGGVERQQVKVFAYSALVFGILMFTTFVFEFPGLWEIVRQSLASSALPVAIAIAVLRYRLYDIDVVIRKTLLYTVLTALLGLVYFGSVILLQQLFGALTGIEQSPLAVVVSTLAIAALFTPLRRRVQDAIDRRFYRRKYNAQQVLAQFAQTCRDETDLDALLAELVRVVDETLQPEHVSVWLRKQEAPKSALASSGLSEDRS